MKKIINKNIKEIKNYQIDQSGKIEQTNRTTIICLANGTSDTIEISAKIKRQLLEIFRRNGQPRNFILFSFCGGLSIILKRNPSINYVVIDREYFGKEPVIKEILLEMLGKKQIEIHFSLIGRKVNAHKNGYLTFIKKLKPKKKTKLKDILEEIKKTEVGKQLKNT